MTTKDAEEDMCHRVMQNCYIANLYKWPFSVYLRAQTKILPVQDFARLIFVYHRSTLPLILVYLPVATILQIVLSNVVFPLYMYYSSAIPSKSNCDTLEL